MNSSTSWPRKIAARLMAVIDIVTDVMAGTSAFLFTILALIITISVLMRYFFSLSVGWSTEIAEYTIYLAVILGTPWVLKKDGHVKVDLVSNLVNPKAQRKLEITSNSIGVLIGIVLLYYSSLTVHEKYVAGTLNVRILPIPEYLPLLFIPLMALIFTFQFLRKTVEAWNGFPVNSDEQETVAEKD